MIFDKSRPLQCDALAGTPVWEQNDRPTNWHGNRYQNYSRQLVLDAHPTWNDMQVEAQAKKEFEEAALNLFVMALKHGSSMRPNTRWGFYGMPQGSDTLEATKKMLPVWQASGALFPSIYEASGINSLTNATYSDAFRLARMKSTVSMGIVAAKLAAAATRAKERIPVYPFAWECYHNGSTFLTPIDLKIDMIEPYAMPLSTRNILDPSNWAVKY